MPSFDSEKAYVAQEDVFFDDGREEALVDFINGRSEFQNSPRAVLKGIDEYARTQKYLMNVGEDKGRIVKDIIHEHKPDVMVELGGYCGYSTILFADAVKSAGGKKYFSLERSPKFAKVIEELVGVAGLGGFAEVIVGPSNEGIKKLHNSGRLTSIDMMFLDHYKPAYTTDLKLCESLGLIQKGAVLAADNVITPGNPPYLKYVRSSAQEKRLALTQESEQDTKNFPGRSAAQYGKVEILSNEVTGNPNLIYESSLNESFEPSGVPDGVEITRCLGEDSA